MGSSGTRLSTVVKRLEHVMIERAIVRGRFLGFDATEWSVMLSGVTAAGLIVLFWM
jgi:hypothetical protein